MMMMLVNKAECTSCLVTQSVQYCHLKNTLQSLTANWTVSGRNRVQKSSQSKQCVGTKTSQLVQIHTHTHTTFNGPFSGSTQVSRYQKGKTNLDFTGARDSEWQWHPLGNMQVCTRGVREQIFRTNSLPFQWLYSHPIPIWNLNPIPIFSHPAIPEFLPFPPGNSNETSFYAQKVGCNKF